MGRVCWVGPLGVVGGHKTRHVHQKLDRGWFAGKRTYLFHLCSLRSIPQYSTLTGKQSPLASPDVNPQKSSHPKARAPRVLGPGLDARRSSSRKRGGGGGRGRGGPETAVAKMRCGAASSFRAGGRCRRS